MVVTSRARYARNLARFGFAPYATQDDLAAICDQVQSATTHCDSLNDYYRIDLGKTTGIERIYLKESRLISREMERSGNFRLVYIRKDLKGSVMVNEEDHLRLQCLEPGLQISIAQQRLTEIDQALGAVLDFAYHERYGYLTACPTNVGTGLRVSVMMHLPGLVMRRELERALKGLSEHGLTVRGFYGENSENTGDFFQISNEVTLGKSVEEIEQSLSETVAAVLDRELEARSLLLRDGGVSIQDAIWRSYGTLSHARKIDSAEAMKLISRIRLGIDDNLFADLTHRALNRLVVDIQPGHLILKHGASDQAEERDAARASLIRKFLGGNTAN